MCEYTTNFRLRLSEDLSCLLWSRVIVDDPRRAVRLDTRPLKSVWREDLVNQQVSIWA